MNKDIFFSVTITMIVLILLILAAIIVRYLLWYYIYGYKKRKSGFLFEEKVNAEIKKYIKGTGLKFIEGGVYSYNNRQFEIDSLLVSPSMLVVLEYKYLSGTMSGDANAKDIQLSSSKDKKVAKKLFRIKNPISQNENHISNINKVLNKDIMYVSIIVVPNELDVQISNIPDHVKFFKVQELETLINELSIQSKRYPELVNVKEVLNIIEIFKIRTLAEKIRFRNKIKSKQGNK
ncbi:nuclease-related domain-containing protein [Mycoplasmopsis edwardii]|nr:nuclease-related domain-containing protein [Mycoplasmopsis edwardii]